MCVQGEKPFKCAYCSHASALRGNCNQHIRKTHPHQPIMVIDLLADTRSINKVYGYAAMEGAGIQECHDVKGTRASVERCHNATGTEVCGQQVRDVTSTETVAGKMLA